VEEMRCEIARRVFAIVTLLFALNACAKSPIDSGKGNNVKAVSAKEVNDQEISDLMSAGFKQGFERKGSVIYVWPEEIKIIEKGELTDNKELPIKFFMKGTRIVSKEKDRKPLTTPPGHGEKAEGTDTVYLSKNSSGKLRISFYDGLVLIEQK
jgi:hypothetical protein